MGEKAVGLIIVLPTRPLPPSAMRPLASEFPSDVERGRVDVHLEEMNSSSIPLGSTTIEDFCTWISDRADVAVKDSVITDISWWEEQAGLRHQLVVLRFEHTEASGDIRVYYIKLERAGRTTCNRRAIDKATISKRAETSNVMFLKRHMLFFALLRTKHAVFLPTGTSAISAFQDFLDHKWRGPPATLKDLARYLNVIVAREPNYTLWSSNCFWFSRHVMHIIGLRHYSFKFIAFTMETSKFALPRTADNMHYGTTEIKEHEWKAHDPSSIGLLFRFLHYEEWRNGILIFRRLIIIVSALFYGGITVGSGYGFYHLFLSTDVQPSTAQKAGYITMLGVAALCCVIALPTIRGSVGLLTRWRIRGATADLVRVIEVESEDAPDCVRGDFIPPEIPLYKHDVGHIRRSGSSYTMRVVPQPRELPTPWEREAQIYAPGRQEYDAALDSMRNLGPTVSQRGFRDCEPHSGPPAGSV
ncbi:hypothetical protein C8F01DRAFT_146285 [Mycena amicta]|nr:hypothetical protein C8F01DRAFT_146285 [Mycena amicta]